MGPAYHQLCLRYSGTLTSTAPTAIKLCKTFTFTFKLRISETANFQGPENLLEISVVLDEFRL